MTNPVQWYKLKGFYNNTPKHSIEVIVSLKKSTNLTDGQITERLQSEISEFNSKWNFDRVEWERFRM